MVPCLKKGFRLLFISACLLLIVGSSANSISLNMLLVWVVTRLHSPSTIKNSFLVDSLSVMILCPGYTIFFFIALLSLVL